MKTFSQTLDVVRRRARLPRIFLLVRFPDDSAPAFVPGIIFILVLAHRDVSRERPRVALDVVARLSRASRRERRVLDA